MFWPLLYWALATTNKFITYRRFIENDIFKTSKWKVLFDPSPIFELKTLQFHDDAYNSKIHFIRFYVSRARNVRCFVDRIEYMIILLYLSPIVRHRVRLRCPSLRQCDHTKNELNVVSIDHLLRGAYFTKAFYDSSNKHRHLRTFQFRIEYARFVLQRKFAIAQNVWSQSHSHHIRLSVVLTNGKMSPWEHCATICVITINVCGVLRSVFSFRSLCRRRPYERCATARPNTFICSTNCDMHWMCVLCMYGFPYCIKLFSLIALPKNFFVLEVYGCVCGHTSSLLLMVMRLLFAEND